MKYSIIIERNKVFPFCYIYVADDFLNCIYGLIKSVLMIQYVLH